MVSPLLIVAFVLYAVSRLREIMVILPERNQKQEDAFYDRVNVTKSRYSTFSRGFKMIIDFIDIAFPFIILFNLEIIFAFYFFNIIVESLRILFYSYSTFLSIIKKKAN